TSGPRHSGFSILSGVVVRNLILSDGHRTVISAVASDASSSTGAGIVAVRLSMDTVPEGMFVVQAQLPPAIVARRWTWLPTISETMSCSASHNSGKREATFHTVQ